MNSESSLREAPMLLTEVQTRSTASNRRLSKRDCLLALPAKTVFRSNAISFYVIHFPLFTPHNGHLAVRPTSKGFRDLAEKTGGRFYRADDLSDVAPAFEAITAELGVQYSLGYYPKSNSSAGTQRSIKVRVRYPNLVVRARDSYTTAPTIARQSGGN